ncbi:MAG TPA: zf-HC2 domain-containing protein [Terracidiphilus sp.]|nr:zf-HC2 domain-containing protein [Terracidiphilus sp.]
MNPTIQPGMHPDAESLTAFAEQVLPAAEREEILAHMSDCSRCREVVFLAQQAAVEDQPAPVAAAVDAPNRPRTSWFNWKWAWIPAAACAGLIGVAVVQHSRRVATETQTAANVAPTDDLRTAGSPKAEVQNPVTRNERQQAKPAKSSGIVAEREGIPPAPARDEAKKLDEKKPADQKDVALAAVPRLDLTPGVAGGSIHGPMAARAKASPIGGPSAANQFQQQNMANQQNMLQQSSGAQFNAADKTVNAATTPRTESDTVTVQAQKVIPVQPAAAPASVQIPAIPTTEENKAAAPANLAEFRKKEKASLPNGLDELSTASDADRTIALDTKGALFLSEDGGKHWKPVRTQWTGRAVLVRSLNTSQKGNALGALGAMKASPPAKFELVTDDLQTWSSADGNIWTLQAMPGK